MRLRASVLSWVGLLLAGACEQERLSPVADLPPLAGLEEDSSRLPGVGPTITEGEAEVYRARHLLVRYQGAAGASPVLDRTRAEARARVEHLRTLARSRQHEFGALARRFSEETRSAILDGDLGWLAWGERHPALEAALRSLGVGQVSEVVESPEGFHLVQRRALETFQAAEIVVAFDGAQRYVPRSPRTREEAARLAEGIRARLVAGASFEAEAMAFSDAPDHERGGMLRPFGPGGVPAKLEEVVRGLPAEGGLSEVHETPTGFHIVARLPLRKVRCRVIGLQVRDGADGEPAQGRSADQALDLLAELRTQALAPGGDFAALASARSEHAAAARGGELVLAGRGRHPPALEGRAFALAEGEVSEIFLAEGMALLLRRVPFQAGR